MIKKLKRIVFSGYSFMALCFSLMIANFTTIYFSESRDEISLGFAIFQVICTFVFCISQNISNYWKGQNESSVIYMEIIEKLLVEVKSLQIQLEELKTEEKQN